jgi:hypothetical protein
MDEESTTALCVSRVDWITEGGARKAAVGSLDDDLREAGELGIAPVNIIPDFWAVSVLTLIFRSVNMMTNDNMAARKLMSTWSPRPTCDGGRTELLLIDAAHQASDNETSAIFTAAPMNKWLGLPCIGPITRELSNVVGIWMMRVESDLH